ncbi:cilia- and flagella-associated protein 52-like isoform X2 [Patagioenas fasciata]|uniref:cilia- and flagella-associated protein 52-like isoform X2 n=1 Tax=Patagioenas fasciata TaxID=372321 RepID=UPI003A9965D1
MAAAKGDGAVGELELQAAIGFNGHVPCGLICHPDKEHILYPLGCTVVIQHLDTQKQSFLHGHTNNVSCVAVSRDGTYVASGQVTCIGFKADIILWDFPKQELLARLSLHEGKVEGLSFSPRGIYLVSLGGQDDGRVMVWDVSKREAVCGSPASPRSAGNANVVVCSSCRDEMFVTAGNFTIRVWELDRATKKIHPSECYTGQLKRIAVCVQMTNDDDDFYLGTTSGDVLKVNTSSKVVTACGPQKKKFSMGVTALLLLKTGGLIVGTGEGTVALCTGSDFQVKKRMRVEGGVTSLTCRGRGDQFFIGTNKCQMYRSAYATFKEELVAVCHTEAVNDIVFPAGHSDLFVTCSTNDIRVWYTPERWERLRITVPNVTCQAVEVTRDGMVILSAWNDGKIRAFVPATGEPMYEINNAHNLGVTAIAATSDCKQIISGGGDGQALRKKTNDPRQHVVQMRVLPSWRVPDNHQWNRQKVLDGSAVREVQGSLSSSINGMDITSDGVSFVTGGDDHLVKLWDYQEGAVTHVGVGHSGSITRLKICPANKFIVSVSADGAVLTWKYPSSG